MLTLNFIYSQTVARKSDEGEKRSEYEISYEKAFEDLR
jgi:hypothetical protein